MKKESKTQNYYDAIARGYSNLYHEEQKIKISKIKEYLPSKGLVLDLGSGDGVLNQFIEQSAKQSQMISLDLSLELLKRNKNKTKIQASAMKLPFKNNKFDYIISFTMLQDVPNPIQVLNEIKRVIKDNGTIILSFLNLSSELEIILKTIHTEFKIIKQIEEEKDYIFILKNN